MKTLHYFLTSLGVLSVGVSLHAQTVNWNDPGPVAPGSKVELQLVFTDCKPTGKVSPPNSGGVRFFDLIHQESSVSLVNFQMSSSHMLTYSAQVNEGGRIEIPAFEIQTDKGKKTVPSLTLDASAPAPSPPRSAPPSAPFMPGFFRNPPPSSPGNPSTAAEIQSETSIQPTSPFVGEVNEVQLTISVPRAAGIDASPISRPLWSPVGAEAEPWREPVQVSPSHLELRTRVMYPKEGQVSLSPVKMTFRTFRLVPTIFGLQRQPAGDVEVSSTPRPVDIKPLPSGAPSGFKGAVGQYTLESKLVPEEVNEGEPVTWTLRLKGTGNWPMGVELPARAVPAKMRTIKPKPRREFDGTQIFTGGLVEDLVMIPTEAGEYELPAVRFVYFDPKKKTYETIEAKPPKIAVLKEGTLRPAGPAQVTQAPASTPQQKQGGGSGWGGFGSGRQAKVLQYGAPALPREPLEGTGIGVAPISSGAVRFLAVLPWMVLAAVWWQWARKRAVLTDPERARKEALQLWKESVQLLRSDSATPEAREKSLLLWQKSVAGTVGVNAATPAWPEISVATPSLQENDRADLEKCWMESDEALYGRNPCLNGDWCDRAAMLANRIDLPPLKVWEPLRPRNLLPWLGILLILALPSRMRAEDQTTSTTPPLAEDPIRLYREGNFEKAGRVWGEAVRKNMTDPVSRNNLGLAWFQIGDKERALANGLSAYLVSPRTETIDWNLMIFADAADQLDPAIRRLLEGTWAGKLTARSGVFSWQLWLLAGSTVAALGVGLWLASGYFAWRRTFFSRAGSGVVLAGAVLAFVAGSTLGVYGKLSDRAAVMIVDVVPLRSVPTEVETQAEKAYPPGSIAHREKEFLGWSKVRLPNHDVGWIRTEHLVSLY